MRLSGTTSGQHSFSQIARADIERSAFNRNHGLKTAFDAGLLIPVFVEEVLPGDTMNLRMHTFARLATPLKPVLDNMYLDSFFFFVPNRLLWDNWQKFNGEQTNPGDSTDFLIPIIDSGGLGVLEGTVYDYMGIPPLCPQITFSALFLRAHNRIWNEWFRDENLQNSLVMETDDGPDLLNQYELQRRGKRQDYFTSCLPFPQKGPAVMLPLADNAPVVSSGDGKPGFGNAGDATIRILEVASTAPNAQWDVAGPIGPQEMFWDDPKLEVDLTGAASATVNALREAFQMQRLLERDARGGSRYTEIIRSHFGVTSPDQRLQRPEYLGGGTQQVTITPVPATTEFTPAPQKFVGDLGGYGTSSGSNHSFTKSFTEHGIILGYVSVRADLTYQNSLNRMWSRRDRFEFFLPVLGHLGEQAVTNIEIDCKGAAIPGSDDLVFGYQERWAEYRYKPSMITGIMRSQHPLTLDVWHLSQEFAAVPTLGSDFIEDNPPITRVIAVQTEPHFLFDAFFEYRCVRPMPTFSTPGMIDHF